MKRWQLSVTAAGAFAAGALILASAGDPLREPQATVAAVDSPSCQSPNCPEPPVWQPEIRQDYDYSEPGVCGDEHLGDIVAEVRLRDREPLAEAVERLAQAVREQGRSGGGRLVVPWDVETVQCDKIRFRNSQLSNMSSFALVGDRGPKGEMPRFYCRGTKADGTIPKGFGGFFFGRSPNDILLEGIEVNGYGSWIGVAAEGFTVVRNSYLHGATNNGFTNNGAKWDKPPKRGRSGQFCGNNISRGGQGNVKHCFYIKRGLPGVESRYALVDNVIHSCNWSEGFKSTGEFNLISGNRFYKTIPPPEFQPQRPRDRITEDPSLGGTKYGNTLVNVAACSNSIIRNNLFHVYRPEPKGHASAILLMFSGRRGIQGCDRPRGYIGNNKSAVADKTNEFWSKSYWDSIAGSYPFTHIVENNRFELSGPTGRNQAGNPRGYAIKMYGTYPHIAVRAFSASCLLEAPPWWRERSRVYSSGNTFVGFDLNSKSQRYLDTYPGHAGLNEEPDGGACIEKGYPYPSTADLRETGKIVESSPGKPGSG
jgi:hypothetical protein